MEYLVYKIYTCEGLEDSMKCLVAQFRWEDDARVYLECKYKDEWVNYEIMHNWLES